MAVKNRYILKDSEREVFLKKVIPTLFIGSLIWLISEIIFATFYTKIPMSAEIAVIIYIIMNIFNALLFILFFKFARDGQTQIALLCYFTFAFSAGIIAVPISMLVLWEIPLSPYVHAFVSLSVGGTVVTLLLGYALKDRFLAGGNFWYHFLFTALGSLGILIVFILVFSVTNWILMIIASIYLIIVALLVLLYGASSTTKVKEEYWVFIVFRILGYLLIFSFLLIITLIIIALMIASEGDFDLGGGYIGGGSSLSKKKKQKSIIMK